MIRFSRNGLSSASQEWARFHESSVRELDSVASQTDTTIENFSREFHGTLDNLNSEVLFLSDRRTYKSAAVPLTIVNTPSTTNTATASYTLQIDSQSRSGLFVATYTVAMYGSGGGIILGEPYTLTITLSVNGNVIASARHGDNGYGPAVFGYAQILGKNAVNNIDITYSVYNFGSTNVTYQISSTSVTQVK